MNYKFNRLGPCFFSISIYLFTERLNCGFWYGRIMDHFLINDLEYVVNDPFEDDFFSEDEPQRNDDSDDVMDSDFEDDFESVRYE